MNKLEEWFEKLPLDKHMFIAQHVKKKIDKIQKDTESILDSCYISAMIELFDMNLDDCIKIAEKANENMDITLKVLNKEGEKYYMKVNNEELRSEIKVEIKALVKENRKINNLEIIRILEETYDFPKKDFQILIKESREELGKEALQEIEKDIEKEVNIEVFKDGVKVNGGEFVVVSEKEVANPKYVGVDLTIKNKDSNSLAIQYPKNLKIKSMEVEGADGRIYLKSSEGVKLGDKVYKDITEVAEEKEAVERRIEAKKEDIRKQIEKLSKELGDIMVNIQKELEKYAEIELVFAM